MNKKYLFFFVLFIVFIGGYCVGKYNNSQRFIFKDDSIVILDTYTGTIYIKGEKVYELKK